MEMELVISSTCKVKREEGKKSRWMKSMNDLRVEEDKMNMSGDEMIVDVRIVDVTTARAQSIDETLGVTQ